MLRILEKEMALLCQDEDWAFFILFVFVSRKQTLSFKFVYYEIITVCNQFSGVWKKDTNKIPISKIIVKAF